MTYTSSHQPTLTEEAEQVLLVQYLELKGHKFSAIPASTFTKSWSVKARNTRTGVRAGVPDMLIALKNGPLIFIELKRVKPKGVVSQEQKLWIEAINDRGVGAYVCYGFNEAKVLIESLLEQRR